MSNPTLRPLVRTLLVLFLFLPFLAPTPASAASWANGGPAAELIAGLWGSLTLIWGEEGCGIDGNGGCRDTQTVPVNLGDRRVTANAGCEIDSNGRCAGRGVVERDAGCGIDGNGGCQP